MNKKKLGIILGAALLVVLVLVMVFVYLGNRPEDQPKDDGGAAAGKSITVQIVYDDVNKTVTINTDEQFLKGALEQEKLIAGSGEGEMFFITAVDGRTADDSKQEWWCITKGGEMWMTGCAATEIADGDAYELTLKTGW